MKIDKAIKELREYNGETFETRFITFSKALQLGIEALKRVKDNPIVPTFHLRARLPGETKD